MKKVSLFVLFLLCCFLLQAQNVGVGTPSPSEKLEVAGNIKTNGVLKFTGTAPAAFRLSLVAGLRYSSTNPLTPDPAAGLFVLLDHPLCNNDPDAIILITSINGPVMQLIYEPTNGYWFLRQAVGFLTNNQNKWNILIVKNVP